MVCRGVRNKQELLVQQQGRALWPLDRVHVDGAGQQPVIRQRQFRIPQRTGSQALMAGLVDDLPVEPAEGPLETRVRRHARKGELTVHGIAQAARDLTDMGVQFLSDPPFEVTVEKSVETEGRYCQNRQQHDNGQCKQPEA